MTLAKICHASNMMQKLVKATHIAATKAILITTFLQLFNVLKKLNPILKREVATLKE